MSGTDDARRGESPYPPTPFPQGEKGILSCSPSPPGEGGGGRGLRLPDVQLAPPGDPRVRAVGGALGDERRDPSHSCP